MPPRKKKNTIETAPTPTPTIKTERIVVSPPNIRLARIKIKGTSPFCMHKFSEKSRKEMLAKQMEEGAGKKIKKAPRDPKQDVIDATHFSEENWIGIPAAAFRNACISACRLVGFKMTIAKLSVFVKHDGLDADDGTPLVKLDAPNPPETNEMAVRLATGVASIAFRPLWREWGATVNLEFDGDQFSLSDVVNLIDRAGRQVGIGEGRPDSKNSAGLGWGQFTVVRDEVIEQ